MAELGDLHKKPIQERRKLDKGAVYRALIQLLDSRPEFRNNRALFEQQSGVSQTTVSNIESKLKEGASFKKLPEIETIEKWLWPFGISLCQFFSQFEQSEDANKVRIHPGFWHYHKLLEGIIDSKHQYFIRSIEGNLYGMLEATGRGLPAGVPPHGDEGAKSRGQPSESKGSRKQRSA